MSELYDRKKREYASQQRPSISSHAAKDEMWQRMRPWALVVQAAWEEHQQCCKPACPVCIALRDAYKESDK